MTQKPHAELDWQYSPSREHWGFTFFGGNLEREALPIYSGDKGRQGIPNEPEPSIIPLARAKVGDRLCVVNLNADHHTAQRLHHMGFCPGTEVRVISRSLSGSVVVMIGDTRLGLGARMSQQVMVGSH
jgi:ferrous iron transport protein A